MIDRREKTILSIFICLTTLFFLSFAQAETEIPEGEVKTGYTTGKLFILDEEGNIKNIG